MKHDFGKLAKFVVKSLRVEKGWALLCGMLDLKQREAEIDFLARDELADGRADVEVDACLVVIAGKRPQSRQPAAYDRSRPARRSHCYLRSGVPLLNRDNRYPASGQ